MGENPGDQRVTGGDEVPNEATVAALALSFLRDDREGSLAILNNTNLPLLVACAMAWWNGVGVKEYGPEEWDRRLVAFLQEAARTRDGGA